MPLTQGGFQQLVTELTNYAEQHNVHIHDGLLVGLINTPSTLVCMNFPTKTCSVCSPS